MKMMMMMTGYVGEVLGLRSSDIDGREPVGDF